jgi:hypothetical protein
MKSDVPTPENFRFGGGRRSYDVLEWYYDDKREEDKS